MFGRRGYTAHVNQYCIILIQALKGVCCIGAERDSSRTQISNFK